jgi:ABC-type phosphate transport system substrate-binding protein
MRQLRYPFITVLVILASLNVWAQGKGYKVIVNPSNPVSSMSREDVARIFLKKTTKFPDGRSALPVDLAIDSSIRENFSRDIHGKSASAVDAYWQQQIFAGRDVPPVQKGEGAALDFVRSNGSGISYVSPGTNTDSVKVVAIID